VRIVPSRRANAHGDDHAVERARGAAGDRLKRADQGRRRDDRVATEVRVRRVRLGPADGDLELVRRGQERSRSRRDGAERLLRPPVQAEDARHGRTEPAARLAEEASVVAHLLAAGAAFLGGLEDEGDVIGPVLESRECAGGAEEDGRVPVVAAGVHDALVLRRVRLAGLFEDREGVHVGAECDAVGGRARRGPQSH
jgi:hypothetical protein